MPKLGHRQPYRVAYVWANGVKGATARATLADAELLADQIETSAHARDLPVTITTSHADAAGVRTVIATRNVLEES